MLVSLFQAGMHAAFPDLVDPPCPLLPSTRGGDYQFNGAMPISGLMKVILIQGVRKHCAVYYTSPSSKFYYLTTFCYSFAHSQLHWGLLLHFDWLVH